MGHGPYPRLRRRDVTTTVLSRSTRSTYIVADDPDAYPHQAMDRDEWERVSSLQDAYIADRI